ncbi:MAG: beta-lactamase hydrolase domain-containing protein [Rhodobacterales bacterium]
MTDETHKIATIDPNHTVALFTPEPEALQQATSGGVKSVVNFRALGEKGGLSPEEEQHHAERLGLNYLHHPVTADDLDVAFVDDFRRSLDNLPQPVFLHCASGRRAGAMTLMALATDKGWDGDTALQEGKARGVDLTEEKIGQFVKSYADEKAGA